MNMNFNQMENRYTELQQQFAQERGHSIGAQNALQKVSGEA